MEERNVWAALLAANGKVFELQREVRELKQEIAALHRGTKLSEFTG